MFLILVRGWQQFSTRKHRLYSLLFLIGERCTADRGIERAELSLEYAGVEELREYVIVRRADFAQRSQSF